MQGGLKPALLAVYAVAVAVFVQIIEITFPHLDVSVSQELATVGWVTITPVLVLVFGIPILLYLLVDNNPAELDANAVLALGASGIPAVVVLSTDLMELVTDEFVIALAVAVGQFVLVSVLVSKAKSLAGGWF